MVIFYYVVWTLSLAAHLSVLRFAEMIFYGPEVSTWLEVLKIILIGFRFDLMIVGFWLSPIVVYFTSTSILFSKTSFNLAVLPLVYLRISWLFICFLYFKDLVSYPYQKNRLWLEDHLQNLFLNMEHAYQTPWWSWVVIILVSIGLYQVGAFRFSKFVQRFQKVGLISLAFIFLWTAFICRGTLTQHHLRRKDCQFSKDPQIEALCLNPLFTFSKNNNDLKVKF